VSAKIKNCLLKKSTLCYKGFAHFFIIASKVFESPKISTLSIDCIFRLDTVLHEVECHANEGEERLFHLIWKNFLKRSIRRRSQSYLDIQDT
jgi:hypothetical protein